MQKAETQVQKDWLSQKGEGFHSVSIELNDGMTLELKESLLL